MLSRFAAAPLYGCAAPLRRFAAAPTNGRLAEMLALEPTKWVFGRKGRFLVKNSHFRVKLKKLAVVRYIFPLPEDHHGRWSRQKYSRGPLETFVPSFTPLILAMEPRK